jgi:hypothetical protein
MGTIYRVTAFEIVEPFVLRVRFDDETQQQVDLRPVLRGELYGPLRDPAMFERVAIDPEAQTLVWPNGADFDPTTLHDWRTPDGRAGPTVGERTAGAWRASARQCGNVT